MEIKVWVYLGLLKTIFALPLLGSVWVILANQQRHENKSAGTERDHH